MLKTLFLLLILIYPLFATAFKNISLALGIISVKCVICALLFRNLIKSFEDSVLFKSTIKRKSSLNEILSEFAADETTANTKFLDKIVAVKGVILETRIEKEKGIITLKTNDDFGSISCHLSAKATKKMDKLKVGEIVIVKGICTGYLMDVILVKSEITN